MNYKLDEKCTDCNGPLYQDFTNRGYVVRCRNPECPVNEIEGHHIQQFEEEE
jgi:ssDNA-binding Zn-finger/Zn-ribbon topoisomerase 1